LTILLLADCKVDCLRADQRNQDACAYYKSPEECLIWISHGQTRFAGTFTCDIKIAQSSSPADLRIFNRVNNLRLLLTVVEIKNMMEMARSPFSWAHSVDNGSDQMLSAF